MAYRIEKAAVIGSGTMGGGIAALLAGVGIETTLLDTPAPGSAPGEAPAARNAIVARNLKALQTSRPPQLYAQQDLQRIRIGNIEDDLSLLADADWVIEAVLEDIAVKRALLGRVAAIVSERAIISSNTSGIPIAQLVQGLPASFTRRFLGTHFFNPPRYLRLLEIIPHAGSDAEIVQFMLQFGSDTLGKGSVLCRDEPNFIGNRFMSMSGMQAMNYALDHGYTVEEVDALTGTLIGRPKTATFHLNDLIGFDIAVGVARNLYHAIPDDPAREILRHKQNAALSRQLLERGWLGRKTGRGFYHMRREGGRKELWALNLQTLAYEPPSRVQFESVQRLRHVEPLGERIRLLMQCDDRAGRFLWHMQAFLLAYASQRVPQITDSIVNIDKAHQWGFAHQLGPFEIWDAIGIEATVAAFEAEGYPVADWVKDMLAAGKSSFYARDAQGRRCGYYCPQARDYLPLTRDRREVTVVDLQLSGAELYSNSDAALYDMGEGVLLWSFTSKHGSITPSLLEAGWEALRWLRKPAFEALLIGHDGERFSIGANLQQAGQDLDLAAVDASIRSLQQLTRALRYAPKPVVVAAHGMALGGGAEIVMAGAAVVAHADLVMGLVEVAVGLLPAGGGVVELLRRLVNPLARAGVDDTMAGLRKAFQTIAMAKVSSSAKEAIEMGLLAETDKIVMNRSQLLGEAKRVALALGKGYRACRAEPVYAAGRDAYAALLLLVAGFEDAGYASAHDGLIARKLAYIFCGGGLARAQFVEQQYILNLERAAFLELLQEPKTQARIAHMLRQNKPLRN